MNLKYYIKKSKSETSSIYVRFWDSNRIDLTAVTGLSVKFSEWSETKQQVKLSVATENKDFINNKLRTLETYLLEQYNIDYNSQQHINKDWLKNKIKKFSGRADKKELYTIYFVDWIQKYIDESPTRLYQGEPVKKKNHTTLRNHKIQIRQLRKAF